MAENLNTLINQVLQSTQLRDCIENCLSGSNINSDLGSTINRSPHSNITRTSTITSSRPAVTVTPTTTAAAVGVRNELRRLFPSIRGSCSSASSSNPNKRHKKESKPFHKDVILLKSSTEVKSLTGYRKVKAFEQGYALNAVDFDYIWSNQQVVSKITECFQDKLNGTEFEILVPCSGYLVKPKLDENVELTGSIFRKIFYNKVVYVRPLQNNQHILNLTDEDESGKRWVELNNLNNSAVINFVEDISLCNTIRPDDNRTYIENPANLCREDMTDNEDFSNNNNVLNNLDVPNWNVLMCAEPTSLTEILKFMQKSLTEENISYFNIYREDIFNCCVRAVQRKSFSPSNKISVIFTDSDNQTEGAIDAGGPRREMFRLLLNYVGRSSKLFAGNENNKIITFNKECLEQNHYFYAGRFIALSIIHEGLGPRFFCETFFRMLTQVSGAGAQIIPTINDVVDIDIRNEIQMAIDAPDLQTLRNTLIEGNYFKIAGWEVINDFSKKDDVVTDAINFYVLERCKKSMEQFIEGLSTMNVYDYMKKYPEYFVELLCNTEEGLLTISKMDEWFIISFSEEGTNKRNVEGRIAAFWKDFLLDCEENDDTAEEDSCTLEEILTFCTGLNVIPSLGFSSKIAISFLHEDSCPYPKGNTCALELYLPVTHVNYQNFKDAMTFGIKNGMVFGFA